MSIKAIPRELRDVARKFIADGHRIEVCKSSHVKWYAPLGIVVTSGSGSDWRGNRNALAELKRKGWTP